MKAARFRISGIGEFEKEWNRSSAARTRLGASSCFALKLGCANPDDNLLVTEVLGDGESDWKLVVGCPDSGLLWLLKFRRCCEDCRKPVHGALLLPTIPVDVEHWLQSLESAGRTARSAERAITTGVLVRPLIDFLKLLKLPCLGVR